MELRVKRNGTSTLATTCTGKEPARAYFSPIPRRRDWFGHRLGWRRVYHEPYPEDRPAEMTTLGAVLDEIEIERPAHAAFLRYVHDDRLLPALRRFRAVHEAFDAENKAWNDLVREQHASIDDEQIRLRQAADVAARPHRERAFSLDPHLREAHRKAAEGMAVIGRSYDPANPAAEAVLAIDVPELGIFAARLNLPDPEFDRRSRLSAWLGWLTTGLIGGLFGLSLGLATGILEADVLERQVGQAIALSILGQAPAIYLRKAIVQCHATVSERSALGRPWHERLGLGVLAFLVDGLVLMVDVLVERAGLLRGVQAEAAFQSLGGGVAEVAGLDFTSYLAPLLISLGYVVSAAWDGYLAGREGVVTNRLKDARENVHSAAEEAHLARPEVQSALAAVLDARNLLHQQRQHEERATAAARPFEERIAALETRRLDYRQAYTEEQRELIQDDHDNLVGPDHEFLRDLRQAVARCEQGSKRRHHAPTDATWNGPFPGTSRRSRAGGYV